MAYLIHIFLFALFNAISAHDDPSAPLGPIPSEYGSQPQLYFNNHGYIQSGKHLTEEQPSTTVCVEIRGGNLCGPQIPGLFTPYHKEHKPILAPTQEIQIQASETKPVVTNKQKGFLVQPPQNQWYFQPAFHTPIAYQPYGLFTRQLPGLSSLPSDGYLSMNCKVGGLKYSDIYPENFPPSGTTLRVAEQPFPPYGQPIPSTYQFMNPTSMAGSDSNSWIRDPLLQYWDMGRRSADNAPVNPNLPHAPVAELVPVPVPVPELPIPIDRKITPEEMKIQSSLMEQENEKKLMELKQQVAALKELASNRQSSAQQQQGGSQPSQQQSNEQKPNKATAQAQKPANKNK